MLSKSNWRPACPLVMKKVESRSEILAIPASYLFIPPIALAICRQREPIQAGVAIN